MSIIMEEELQENKNANTTLDYAKDQLQRGK